MRLTQKQTNGIKEKLGVDRLWSYSRLSTYINYPFEYRIAYLERKARGSNVYTHFGSIAHDTIQSPYESSSKFEDMGDVFKKHVKEWRADNHGFTFPNKSIETSYIQNLDHYFAHPDVLPYEVTCERPVLLKLHDDVRDKPIAFIGYADAEYWKKDEEGNDIFCILDFKSSSKSGFTGKQLKEKSKQLYLYAMAISQQRNIPLSQIVVAFDMMKYVNVSYLQANGKWKPSAQERRKWVESQEKKIRKLLLDNDMDIIEVDLAMEQAKFDNDLSSLPKYVQDRFQVGNCYIESSINDEEAAALKEYVTGKVRECETKELGDWEVEFPDLTTEQLDDFYWNVLSPQIREFSQTWQDNKLLKQKDKGVDAMKDNFFDELFA